MIVDEIRQQLFLHADQAYKAFQSPLIPTVPGARFIGVRTPVLRAMAKELFKREDVDVFLADLPHGFFEEDQLHAFLISEIKSFDACLREVDRFLADGIRSEELDRARELIKSSIILSMESTSARMNRLGSSILSIGRCLSADEIIERYNAVTMDDVMTLARETIRDEAQSLSAVGRIADSDGCRELLRQAE